MMSEQFCETCGMKLRSTPESKLTQCCCCMAIDAQHELHDIELTQLRAENARLKSAHSHMEQELNTLRSREMNIDDIADYTETIQRLRQQNVELVEVLRKAVKMDTCGCLKESYIKCTECWQIDRDIEAAIAKHGEVSK